MLRKWQRIAPIAPENMENLEVCNPDRRGWLPLHFRTSESHGIQAPDLRNRPIRDLSNGRVRTQDPRLVYTDSMGTRRNKQGDPSKVVAYLRVSTGDQRLGIDAQRDAVTAWCEANGAEMVACIFDQGVSGALPIERRTGLLDAVMALQTHGAGVLLVAKRDRIARDAMIALIVEAEVAKAGAVIVSTDGSGNGNGPTDKLVRTILAAVAEHERAMIAARTRAALASKRARGQRTGGVPFGFRLTADGSTLEADPAEQAMVARIHALSADGLSLRDIAAELGSEGCRGTALAPYQRRPHPCSLTACRRPPLRGQGRGSKSPLSSPIDHAHFSKTPA